MALTDDVIRSYPLDSVYPETWKLNILTPCSLTGVGSLEKRWQICRGLLQSYSTNLGAVCHEYHLVLTAWMLSYWLSCLQDIHCYGNRIVTPVTSNTRKQACSEPRISCPKIWFSSYVVVCDSNLFPRTSTPVQTMKIVLRVFINVLSLSNQSTVTNFVFMYLHSFLH
jgi:hypothetical protein